MLLLAVSFKSLFILLGQRGFPSNFPPTLKILSRYDGLVPFCELQHVRRKHVGWCWFIINLSITITKLQAPGTLQPMVSRNINLCALQESAVLIILRVLFFYGPAALLAFRTVIGIFAGPLNCWRRLRSKVNSSLRAIWMWEEGRASRKGLDMCCVLSDKERKLVRKAACKGRSYQILKSWAPI